MTREKGQIHIVLIVLVLIGFFLLIKYPQVFRWGPGTPASSRSTSPASSPKLVPAPAPVLKAAPPAAPTPTPAPVPAPDNIPPKRSNPQPTGSLPSQTRKTTLSLETDEKAICKYSDITGVFYEHMQHTFSETAGTLHSTLITTLSEGEAYKYYVRCADEKGNKNADDFVISFGVKKPEDNTPPLRRNPSHTGEVLPAGTSEVVISISTDEQAVCRYSTAQGTPYSSMNGRFSYYDKTKLFHVATIKNLENGKTYDFFARCQDLKGNTNTSDVMIRFIVGT